MTSEKKISIQTWCAVGLLISGFGLACAGFCVPPVGEISDSVLMYIAEAFTMAGTCFGIMAYVNGRLAKITKTTPADETE
ncbi:MAG: hypothetical protein IKQ62_00355 [Bacteroidaceae bacterium]|nr:hypothetical protein [Bacteroidaceae bacterium]MBR6201437.1 hypothetical protein [Bacteroidaceae bacterium]